MAAQSEARRARHARTRRWRIQRRRNADRLRRCLRRLADPDQVWAASGEVLDFACELGPGAAEFCVAILDVLDAGHAQLVVADRGRVAAWQRDPHYTDENLAA